ncbi:MAG: addiction module toxin RelE [archaeon]|nr:addiction module toxin RelE [archaeon]
MNFRAVISDELEKTLAVLKKKDKSTFINVKKKICRITACDSVVIDHFKNLKGDMSNLKRVHVGSFVLVFRIVQDVIVFESFKHHDKSYI